MPSLNLTNELCWPEHRSGWTYALSLLSPYQQDEGIVVDGCLDATFGYRAASCLQEQKIPYRTSWVGFLHHPVHICPWYYQENLSPRYTLESEPFRQSLPYCQGIFTLSEYLAQHVRDIIHHSVKVLSVAHPTEQSPLLFNPDKFRNDKKVVQVGYWMRRLTSLFKLKADGYSKILPVAGHTLRYLKNEIQFLNHLTQEDIDSVNMIEYLPHSVYDEMLAESVVFLDLYDSSANNAVIECILRNTPLLVNKIRPVVEYLGEEYPFYYRDLEEAGSMLQDDGLIEEAHAYLQNHNLKERLKGSSFLRSVLDSPIFS